MLFLLQFLPKNHLSAFFGYCMHWQLPEPLRRWSLQWFARTFHVRVEDSERPVDTYKSIGDFFVRKLKPGLRPLAAAAVVHPADSVLSQCGRIQDGQMLQIKGQSYLLAEIFQDAQQAKLYDQGMFATYYLCPSDYHRVHSPVDGVITQVSHIPGTLWPVYPLSVRRIKNLFAINERIVVSLQTSRGEVSVVFIGAMNVGKIELSFDATLQSQTFTGPALRRKAYSPPVAMKKGEELGLFRMGSTVVVFYPAAFDEVIDCKHWQVLIGHAVKYGESAADEKFPS